MSDYPISADVLQSQHVAILATTGAGKSYLTRGVAEVIHRHGWRHGIVDKLGNYWGLTISADGEAPGLDYVIFGGRRAHVEMAHTDGEKIAALFLEHDIPAIFDLSLWKSRQQEQWVRDFCDYVYLHNEGSLNLIMDEIQSWAGQDKSADCYASVERMFTQGRGLGIKIIMAAQRPARVSKDVLYMASSIVAMRMVGKIDRKWVVELLEPYVEDIKVISNALPGLKTGQGYLYDPIAGATTLVQFPANETFDSSATPKHGDTTPTVRSATSGLVDLLREALAPKPTPEELLADKLPPASVETGEAKTAQRKVVQLQGRVAELEARIDDFTIEQAVGQQQLDAAAGYVAFTENVLKAIAQAVDIPFETLSHRWPSPFPHWPENGAAKGWIDPEKERQAEAAGFPQPKVDVASDYGQALEVKPGSLYEKLPKTKPAKPERASGEMGSLAGRFLAEIEARYPVRLSWEQWAALVQRKAKGAQFNTAKAELRASGRIDEDDAGVKAVVGSGAAPKTREEVIQSWRAVLPSMALRIFDDAVASGGGSYEEVGRRIERNPAGPQWNAAISQLRANGLIFDTPGQVMLISLMPGE